MYTGIRLSTLAVGEPLLNQNYTYNEKYGKEAIISRLEDQFIKIYNLGIKYVIDTIVIQNNNSVLSLYQGDNGEYWPLDERVALYQQFSKKYNLNIVLEIDFQQITSNNVNDYIYTILYDIILQYSWVQYWIIGIRPDDLINDTYKCSPELYIYILKQIYPKIKSFNSSIQIGGPNIHEQLNQYMNNRTGWLDIAAGNKYNEDYSYQNIGKNGLFDYIDIFAIYGKQDSLLQNQQYSYSDVIYNLRELIYTKLYTNNILIFATNQGHNIALSDNQIKNNVIDIVNANPAIANYTDYQLNEYTQQLIKDQTTNEINKQAFYDVKEICSALKCGVISFKRELLNSKYSTYGIFISPSINTNPKSTIYSFIYNILSQYDVVVKDSSIYETNNNVESITLQTESNNIIKRATIIWPKTLQNETVLLKASTYFRQYYINNINKELISYNQTTELHISFTNLLVVYEQVNQFVFNESDIATNISRRLRYQREIVDHMMAELPSSFNRDTTDTNVYKLFRSIAAEFADASMKLTMVKEDNLIDNAREDALYHNFGTLIKLEKQSNWSYEKYRQLIKGILSSLFKGPTTSSVATALQLFTNFKVSISELYKPSVQKKYAELLNYYNPQFTFIIELEKPLDDNTYTQEEIIRDNTYILQLTKPAHTIGILIIILADKENWQVYYRDKYNTNWITNDENNVTIDFNKMLAEGTYGWKAHNYYGVFNTSPQENNGIYSTNSLLNGSNVIGPRYTLFDTAYLHEETTIKDIYHNNRLKEQLIHDIGTEAIEQYTKYKTNLYEISASLVEPKFGFIDNNYMQLSGNNIIDKVLNNHLLHGKKTKLKDELLIQQQQFLSDKFLFSSVLNAIQFDTPNGINKQFVALNNIITEWQTYLHENPFKEKLINGEVIERITDRIDLYLQGYKEKFKRIYDSNKFDIDVRDETNIADNPIPPIQLNDLYSDKKFLSRRREKINYAVLNKELYNIAEEFLSQIIDIKIYKEYYQNVIEHSYNNIYDNFADQFILSQNNIQFNKHNGTFIIRQIEKFDLFTYYNDFYNQFIEDISFVNSYHYYIDKYEFNITDQVTSISNEFTDKFILNQNNLQFNKHNGTLITKQIEKFDILYWYNDQYNIPITDTIFYNLYNVNIDKYQFAIDDQLTNISNYFNEKFIINQNNLQFNKRNGKFISAYTEKINLSNYYTDNCSFEIKDLLLVSIDTPFIEKFIKKDDKLIYIENYFADKYILNQNNLQFNKNNGKLITKNIEKFDLFNYYIDNYSFKIKDLLLVNIDTPFIEEFINKKDDKLIYIENYFTDKYILNPNNLQFNKNNGKLITKNIEKFDLFNYYIDNYSFKIKDINTYTIDNTEKEKYKDIRELTYINTWFSDHYQIDSNENILQLNKNNGKFISRYVNTYSLNYWYIDNYSFTINDQFTYNLDNTEKEKYKDIQELPYINTHLNDQFILIDEDNNDYLYLQSENNNVHTNDYNLNLKRLFGRKKFNSISSNLQYIDNYSFTINDKFTYNIDNIENEKYKDVQELPYINTHFNDHYQIDSNENILQLNKNNGKFISCYVNTYSLNYWYIDNYSFTIKDQSTYDLDNIENEKYKDVQELPYINTWFSDHYQIDSNENILQLNKNNGKFISRYVNTYSLNYWYIDNYSFTINDKFTYGIDNIEKEKYKDIQEETYINTYFNDHYQIDSNENILQLNKNNGKFISRYVNTYSLNYWYIDNYSFTINDQFTYNLDNTEKEKYKDIQELPYINTHLNDQFILIDEDNNDYLYLQSENNNVHTNDYNLNLKRLFGRKKFNSISSNLQYIDNYSFTINDKFTYNIDNIENEKYKDVQELPYINTHFNDHYQIDSNENILQLNKNNGKFISRYVNTYSLNYWYIDNYSFKIKDINTYSIDNIESEEYKDIQELPYINTHFNDHYQIDSNENILQLNKNNGKFISHYVNTYSLNYQYRDNYSFVINDKFTYGIDNTEKEKYKDIQEETSEVITYFTDQYSFIQNALKLNGPNNKAFIKNRCELYSFYLDLNEKCNFNIADSLIITLNNSEEYIIKNDHVDLHPLFSEQYFIKDKILQLNKHNGKFISTTVTKCIFDYLYIDKYNKSIKEQNIFNIDNYEQESIVNEISEDWTLNYIYSETYSFNNDYLQLNNLNNKAFIRTLLEKIQLRIEYNDIYNFVINDYNNINSDVIYNEVFNSCYEINNTITINSTYNEHYTDISDKIYLSLFHRDNYSSISIQDFIYLYSIYTEQFNKGIDQNTFMINSHNQENNIYNIKEKTNWRNDVIDEYKDITEQNQLYLSIAYENEDKIVAVQDTINQLDTLNKDIYFNLNTDNRKLKFNLMQLNNSQFFTSSNENHSINLQFLPEHIKKAKDNDTENIQYTDKVNKPKIKNTDINMEIDDNIMYSNAIQPFQFSSSRFNNKKFLYKRILDHYNIEFENSELYKPIIALNHINLQCHDELRKAEEKLIIYPQVYYNEIYKKYQADLHSKYIEINDKDHYKLLSTVAYMQAEKLINNKYIIIKKNSYV